MFIDLSHRIVDGMTTYPGLPGPELTDRLGRADTGAHMAPGASLHHFGTSTYADAAPFLAEEAVAELVRRGAAMVGIDSLNLDDVDDLRRPAHAQLLGAGIPIVEHLRGLEQLPADGFQFTATPPPVAGMGTFPVRAFAVVS